MWPWYVAYIRYKMHRGDRVTEAPQVRAGESGRGYHRLVPKRRWKEKRYRLAASAAAVRDNSTVLVVTDATHLVHLRLFIRPFTAVVRAKVKEKKKLNRDQWNKTLTHSIIPKAEHFQRDVKIVTLVKEHRLLVSCEGCCHQDDPQRKKSSTRWGFPPMAQSTWLGETMLE